MSLSRYEHRTLFLSLLILIWSASALTGCESKGDEGTQTCEPGTTFDADDGCNTCQCPDSGEKAEASCTLLECISTEPCTEEECGPALGMASSLCLDGETWGGPGPCERQEDNTCAWTIVQCPDEYFCDDKDCGDSCNSVIADSDCDDEGCGVDIEFLCNSTGACVEWEGDSELLCADLCAGVVCPSSSPSCEGTWAHNGSYSECDATSGECIIAPGLPPEDCAEFGQICEDGACVPGEYDACADLACGDSCSTCPPDDEDCISVGALTYCNGLGECVTDAPETLGCDEGPCAGKSCGDACNTASGAENADMVAMYCNPEGECVEWEVSPEELCEEDLCAGKECGEWCTPDGGGTGQPDQLPMYCDADGNCVEWFDDPALLCDEDLCANVECPSTADECDGDTLVHGSYSECNPSDGLCVQAPGLPPEDCTEQGLVCENAQCVELASTLCEPGTNFLADDGCNNCFCLESGKKADAECTEILCPATCTPGESFQADDGCNTCTCTESGLKGDALCTEIACEVICWSAAGCDEGYFCDFASNDCGLDGGPGTCTPMPDGCDAGGSGACGCEGALAFNACELSWSKEDTFEYGGCAWGDNSTYKCGDKACSTTTEYCAITINDVVADPEPAFYSNCIPLIDECATPSCSCVPTPGDATCFDGAGYAVVIYPGG